MPIFRHLQGPILDPEGIKAITTAYEKACVDLQLNDRDDPLTKIEIIGRGLIST